RRRPRRGLPPPLGRGPALRRRLASPGRRGRPARAARPTRSARAYRIGVVPGLLAECFDGIIRPFAEAMDELARAGFVLADRLNPAFRRWLSGRRMRHCRRGAGEEFEALRREARRAGWQRYRTAVTTPVFALVTTPCPDRLSPLVKEMYDKLADM